MCTLTMNSSHLLFILWNTRQPYPLSHLSTHADHSVSYPARSNNNVHTLSDLGTPHAHSNNLEDTTDTASTTVTDASTVSTAASASVSVASKKGLAKLYRASFQDKLKHFKKNLNLAQKLDLQEKPRGPELETDASWNLFCRPVCEKMKRNVDDHANCPICLQGLGDPEKRSQVILYPCAHVYHQRCLNSYEKFLGRGEERKCPMCRCEYADCCDFGTDFCGGKEVFRDICARKIQRLFRAWYTRKAVWYSLTYGGTTTSDGKEQTVSHSTELLFRKSRLKLLRRQREEMEAKHKKDLDTPTEDIEEWCDSLTKEVGKAKDIMHDAIKTAVLERPELAVMFGVSDAEVERMRREQQRTGSNNSDMSNRKKGVGTTGGKSEQQLSLSDELLKQQEVWDSAKAKCLGRGFPDLECPICYVEMRPACDQALKEARIRKKSGMEPLSLHDRADGTPGNPRGVGVVLLSCSHVFHCGCLRSFEEFQECKSEIKCPVCRVENYEKRLWICDTEKIDAEKTMAVEAKGKNAAKEEEKEGTVVSIENGGDSGAPVSNEKKGAVTTEEKEVVKPSHFPMPSSLTDDEDKKRRDKLQTEIEQLQQKMKKLSAEHEREARSGVGANNKVTADDNSVTMPTSEEEVELPIPDPMSRSWETCGDQTLTERFRGSLGNPLFPIVEEDELTTSKQSSIKEVPSYLRTAGIKQPKYFSRPAPAVASKKKTQINSARVEREKPSDQQDHPPLSETVPSKTTKPQLLARAKRRTQQTYTTEKDVMEKRKMQYQKLLDRLGDLDRRN